MIELALQLIRDTAFLNNLLLLFFFVGFAYVFHKENNDDESPIKWIHMIVDTKTQRLSLNKLSQFWGMAISSWIVIYMAQIPATYAIFPMVFAAWLAFIGGSYAFNTFLKNKKEEPK